MFKRILLLLLAIQITNFIYGQSNVGINRIPETTLDIKPIPDGFNFGNALARLSDTTGTYFMTLRSGSVMFPGAGISWGGSTSFSIGNPIERLTILGNGKVGINRLVPEADLHIQATGSTPAMLRLSDINETNELTLSSGNTLTEGPHIKWSDSDTLRFGVQSNNTIHEKMSIATNGNVHIHGTIQSDSLLGSEMRPATIDFSGTIRPGSNVAFHVIQTVSLDTVKFAAESILFDSILVDNTNSYVFQDPPIPFSYYTAPEDGLYFLTCSVTHRMNSRLSVYIELDPDDGGLEKALSWAHGTPDPNTSFRGTITTSALAYLKSGDRLRVVANGPIGAIISNNSTSFTGYKLW